VSLKSPPAKALFTWPCIAHNFVCKYKMNRLRHMSNENLREEYNGRRAAIARARHIGMTANWANYMRAQTIPLFAEIVRRRMQANKNRKTRETVKKAANFWLARSLYKPGTATSPAGSRAAAAISAHTPHMTYAQVQAAMRAMNRARNEARRARARHASTSTSPNSKTRRT
jgi:hypothetical protein